MSSSSVANSMAVQIPECGCKKPMRMYVSNTTENPKRRFWKCATHGKAGSCNLFDWDDLIEGHPPYMLRVVQRRGYHCKRNSIPKGREDEDETTE
ncbi:zinc finger homeodomain protein [Trifolium pratense]|uniref:Zinc finger homeodomain protein n=1 Tax=Trifolium pratense TaxID=57577 RepID=A0A2K3JKJ9_TRIPR|nr:zinc finger homeodomain protein [Trifolium pratense]